MGEEMRILSIHAYGTSRLLLHAVKSYDMGLSRFTSQKQGYTVSKMGKYK
jgi:hypothetical protein